MPLFSAVFAKMPVFQKFLPVNVKAINSVAFFENG